VNLGILAAKGSLYVTRPILHAYVATTQAMQAAASEMFDLVTSGKLNVVIGQRFALKDAGLAHEALKSRHHNLWKEIDQQIELTIGEKERCIGALNEHRKEHGC